MVILYKPGHDGKFGIPLRDSNHGRLLWSPVRDKDTEMIITNDYDDCVNQILVTYNDINAAV